jgi:exodeoxyribonuclease-3
MPRKRALISMITVYGLNVDAFKASKCKPFFDLMRKERPDVVCLQETGCEVNQIPHYARLDGYSVAGNHGSNSAGRTGVAILSRQPQSALIRKICAGEEHETCRGRFVEVTIGVMKFASVYAHPHDTKSADRRQARILFNECLKGYMLRSFDLRCIISLDANVALSREDVATDTQFSGPWASRTYRDSIVSAMEGGRWLDSYRAIHGRRRRATVWTPANYESTTEMGYAIDFQLVSKPLSSNVLDAEVLKPGSWSERYSDHAPTIGRYSLEPS